MTARPSALRCRIGSIPLATVLLLLVTLLALPAHAGLLNDTGIDWCADASTNNLGRGARHLSAHCAACLSTPGHEQSGQRRA